MKLCALCLAKIVTSHRTMSYVTPHLSVILGTCTPSLTRPTSLSSDPLLGELQPCADLRQLERGSPTVKSSSSKTKRLSEYQDLAEHEDLLVKPQPSMDDDQIRALQASPLYLQERDSVRENLMSSSSQDPTDTGHPVRCCFQAKTG